MRDTGLESFSLIVTTYKCGRLRKRKSPRQNLSRCIPRCHFAFFNNKRSKAGSALGCHLGWSGNHKTQIDVMSDGRTALSMGELLLPGEVTLAKGERYETPMMYCAQTQSGLNDLSASFHTYVRNNLAPRATKPRPVHYNTWEGLYFDHDMDTLLDLVKRASDT